MTKMFTIIVAHPLLIREKAHSFIFQILFFVVFLIEIHIKLIIQKMFDTLEIPGYYAIVNIVLGTASNLIMFYISIRIKNNSIFVLFRYLAFCDIVSLYFWNLHIFTLTVLGFDLKSSSLNTCKYGSWIQYSTLQSSAWIIVI